MRKREKWKRENKEKARRRSGEGKENKTDREKFEENEMRRERN